MNLEKHHITETLFSQARILGQAALAVLASIRVQAERIKGSRAARIVCWVILAALGLTLWTLVTFRVAQRDAERAFDAWRERYVNDFVSQREAEERGMPMDPRAELRKQENMEFARLISGLKLYQYGTEDFITLAQCVKNRELNPAYPGTIVEVIRQPNQWPGYYETNEVTESTYRLAASVLDQIRAQERQPCSSDLTIADFGKHITLRNTMGYNIETVKWRYGE